MKERIELLIKIKNLNPAQFADELDVQRANVSHILNGRNNPSLDFVQRIIKRYPDINIPWLLFGEGPVIAISTEVIKTEEEETVEEKTPPITPDKNVQPFSMSLFPEEDTTANKEMIPEGESDSNVMRKTADNQDITYEKWKDENILEKIAEKIIPVTDATKEPMRSVSVTSAQEKESLPKDKDKNRVEKIVFFYTDRTFEEFRPGEG